MLAVLPEPLALLLELLEGPVVVLELVHDEGGLALGNSPGLELEPSLAESLGFRPEIRNPVHDLNLEVVLLNLEVRLQLLELGRQVLPVGVEGGEVNLRRRLRARPAGLFQQLGEVRHLPPKLRHFTLELRRQVLSIVAHVSNLLDGLRLGVQELLARSDELLDGLFRAHNLALQAIAQRVLQFLDLFLNRGFKRQARHRVAVNLNLQRNPVRLFVRRFHQPEPLFELFRLGEPLIYESVQVDRAQRDPVFIFFLFIREFHEERLGPVVHLGAASGAHRGVHHTPEEPSLLARVADSLEHEREVQKVLDLLVVRGANFLERGFKLELALLKHQAHVHLRQHLV